MTHYNRHLPNDTAWFTLAILFLTYLLTRHIPAVGEFIMDWLALIGCLAVGQQMGRLHKEELDETEPPRKPFRPIQPPRPTLGPAKPFDLD